jgi:excisionase family DNA binding protein
MSAVLAIRCGKEVVASDDLPLKLVPKSKRGFEPKILTAVELAEYLRVDKSTIYRLLKQKLIPGFKIGSDWRFNIEEIEAWRLKK